MMGMPNIASLLSTIAFMWLTFIHCLDGVSYTSQLMYRVENAELVSISGSTVTVGTSSEDDCILRCLSMYPSCTAANYEVSILLIIGNCAIYILSYVLIY